MDPDSIPLLLFFWTSWWWGSWSWSVRTGEGPLNTVRSLDLYLLRFRWESPGTSRAGNFILDNVILWIMRHFGSIWQLWHLLGHLLHQQSGVGSGPLWPIGRDEYHQVNVPILIQRWVFLLSHFGSLCWDMQDCSNFHSAWLETSVKPPYVKVGSIFPARLCANIGHPSNCHQLTI